MKQFNTLIICISFLLPMVQMQAQDTPQRYIDEIFPDVQVSSDLIYGVNATILLQPLLGEAIPQQLLFDFYEPVGDSSRNRPLVIMFSTGNFLPIQVNRTVLGTKSDSSNVEIATRLAKMGYVVASVTYRQGWNPTAPTQPERALGLIQAAYRGVQDARTAIRFFKQDFAENGNNFGVDTSRITLWGIGTGGYVSTNTAYLNTYNEIIMTENPPAKFLLDADMDEVPETPMVIEAFLGNITGETLGVIPPTGVPGFPFPPNDTLCYPNHVGYSSEFQLVVNMAGALGDFAWLDNVEDPRDNIPVIAYHLPTDPFAPYEEDVLIVPTTGDRIVNVNGSKTIVEKAVSLGINNVFIDANIDDEFTQRAREASAEAGHEYFEGLFPFIRPLNDAGNPEGDPWQWWDSEFWSTVPFDTIEGNVITFEDAARANNLDASPEKARIYIDTVIGYFAPRAYAALDLANADTTTTSLSYFISDAEVGLQMAPNPAQDFVNFQTNIDFPIRDLQLYNLNGALVRSYTNVKQSNFRLERDGLPQGLYVAKLRFDKGILTKKIIFN